VTSNNAFEQEGQLRELERVGRLRTLRNWTLCLGILAFVLATIATEIPGSGNLKNWSNLYVGLAVESLLQWSITPLIAAGSALAIVGGLLHGLVKRRHGEV
jgi:hypothetical protein